MSILPIIKSSSSEAQSIIKNPCASYWLKDALIRAMGRDCVDALSDAETLVAIMRLRCKEAGL